MAEEQLVVFSLGKEEYAISITQVKEIIRYKDATKLPNTLEYMEGIITLRGIGKEGNRLLILKGFG